MNHQNQTQSTSQLKITPSPLEMRFSRRRVPKLNLSAPLLKENNKRARVTTGLESPARQPGDYINREARVRLTRRLRKTQRTARLYLDRWSGIIHCYLDHFLLISDE
jgi:hypothetical protein